MNVFVFLMLFSASYAFMRHAERSNDIASKEYSRRYAPTWEDLDTRPLPEWYDRAKIGIFLHWGVYSVPGFGSEWFWNNWKEGGESHIKFMEKNYPPGFTYQEFAPMFKAEFFDPELMAKFFARSGAKYIVLTSKHHEGFTLFPSKRSFSWNSVEVGPKRDLVGEIAKAVRNENMKFGVYHSLYEWFNPIYVQDKSKNFTTQTYVDTKLLPDIKQLINDYKPAVLWSDGDWETTDSYWRSKELLAWLYNDSPVKDEIVVNDRWGKGCYGKHGDFYNYQDRFNPGKLLKHKWENAFTVDNHSWGYRRNIKLSDILTIEELLEQVISTVSCGGNALINIGPTKEATIAPIFQERLISLGDWLTINGEAIYDTSPWTSQNDSANADVWYTCTKTTFNAANPTAMPSKFDNITAIYASFLEWPVDGVLMIRDIASHLHSGNYQVEMLGTDGYLKWQISDGDVNIQMPDRSEVKSEHAWCLKISLK